MKILTFYFILATIIGYAQTNPVPDNVRATNAIDAFTTNTVSPGYMLYGIPQTDGGITGHVYLNDTWEVTSLKLFGSDRVFSNYPGKLNLYTNQIEVKVNDVVRTVESKKVENFYWDRNSKRIRFVNASQYQLDQAQQEGFLEVLAEGKIPLLKKTRVIIKKPDYNVQLNVGSKSTRIIKEETIYYAKGNLLVNIKTVKGKKISALFENHAPEVNRFIKDEAIRTSGEEGLVRIFKYANSLE